jgi:hypothetical protein
MTYKYIVIEPRAVFPGEDTEAYRTGAISERALALAAPTLQLRIEEMLEEIRQLKNLGNEKLRAAELIEAAENAANAEKLAAHAHYMQAITIAGFDI